MSKVRNRTGALVVATFLLLAVASATAYAAVHVTHATLTSSTMSTTLDSTGDAGMSHGNLNNGTSPIAPSASGTFRWINQPALLSGTTMVDTADADNDIVVTGLWSQLSTNGSTWGPLTAVSGAVSAEGIYMLSATGTDDGTPIATATISPAFGIDMTKPVVTTAVQPVYLTSAVVTITSSDAMSGVENVQYSVDGGPFDFSWDAAAGPTFAVPVSFGPGTHTLKWHAFDNAGNINSGSVSFIVRPTLFVPGVSLNIAQRRGSEENSHFVTFSGHVSAMPSSMTLTIVVQRRVSGIWTAYTSYTKTIPAFASSYSLLRHIPADAHFRAIAMFDGGLSSYKPFVIR